MGAPEPLSIQLQERKRKVALERKVALNFRDFNIFQTFCLQMVWMDCEKGKCEVGGLPHTSHGAGADKIQKGDLKNGCLGRAG